VRRAKAPASTIRGSHPTDPADSGDNEEDEMLANEILKAAKKPMSFEKAKELETKIMGQKFAEQEYEKYHAQAQTLRMDIQHAMGFGCDEYYQFVRPAIYTKND
jgi:hypothetical protein